MSLRDPNAGNKTFVEHDETPRFALKKNETDEYDIEPVTYGYNGVKAWLHSPYVFGAALLASMGGFSYGYGKSHAQLPSYAP